MELKIYLIVLLSVSLITYILYYLDKKKSEKKKWRIKEKTLLLFSFLGGAIGGLLGMYVNRHKTKHLSFIIVNWLSFILQISLGIFIFIYFK